jgi:hypothetical protein
VLGNNISGEGKRNNFLSSKTEAKLMTRTFASSDEKKTTLDFMPSIN